MSLLCVWDCINWLKKNPTKWTPTRTLEKQQQQIDKKVYIIYSDGFLCADRRSQGNKVVVSQSSSWDMSSKLRFSSLFFFLFFVFRIEYEYLYLYVEFHVYVLLKLNIFSFILLKFLIYFYLLVIFQKSTFFL